MYYQVKKFKLHVHVFFSCNATLNKCAQNLSDLNTLQNFLPHLFKLLRTLRLKVNSKPLSQKDCIYNVILWYPKKTLNVQVQSPETPTEP